MNSLVKKNGDLPAMGETWLAPFSQFRWGVDRLLGDFLSDFSTRAGAVAPTVPLEVSETDDQIIVRAEIPGISPEDIDVNLSGDVLTISGEKTEEHEEEKGGRKYSERSYGSFRRSIQLSSPVDPEKVAAKHENGLVTITLEKAAQARSHRIPVQG